MGYFQLTWCREKPLALYIFGKDKDTLRLINQNTSSGAIVFNDTMMHAAGIYL